MLKVRAYMTINPPLNPIRISMRGNEGVAVGRDDMITSTRRQYWNE